ncbi:MAG: protein kinase [Planctomycetia bacterium]|nr:protein kinase [Planctomycetia bacterium]
MDLESRLLDLMVEWNEAVLVGKVVSIEGLAPNDPELQRRLREALAQQKTEKSGIESTSTGLYVPTEGDGQLLGLNFPGFRITGEIGRGGMGIVFEADDVLLGRKVALKTIRPELAVRGDAKARFLHEARAAASIRSDHVVTIHRVDEANGVPFIAMEYLQGQPLNVWMKEHRAGPSHICRIGHEIALGLSAAHESGHIHRDIKPGNIWLEAPNGRVKILDFGLARTVEADFRLTGSNVIIGTPAYMAPEQGRNESADHRSDLFSLGAVLYQLATGRRPFQGRDVFEVLESLATQIPPPARSLNPEIGPALSDLIARLLSKDPAGRPQTAREVASALRKIHKAKAKAPQPIEYMPAPMMSTPSAFPLPAMPAPAAPAGPPRDAWTDIELDALPGTALPTAAPATTLPTPKAAPPTRPLGPRLVLLAGAVLMVVACAALLLKFLLAPPAGKAPPDDPKKKKVEADAPKPDTPKPEPPKPAVAKRSEPWPAVVPLRPARIASLDHLAAATHVPPAERFDWQPKELVAVLGSHRLRMWADVESLKLAPDGASVLVKSRGEEYARLIDLKSLGETVVAAATSGFALEPGRVFHGLETFPATTPLLNRTRLPIKGRIMEFVAPDRVLAADADNTNNFALWSVTATDATELLKLPVPAIWQLSPDRRRLAVITRDGIASIHRLHGMPGLEFQFPDPARTNHLSLANDRLALVNAEGYAQVWTLGGAAPTLQHTNATKWAGNDRFQLSADGKRFKFGHAIWNLDATPAVEFAADPTRQFATHHAVFFDDNRRLVTAFQNRLFVWSTNAGVLAPTVKPGLTLGRRNNERAALSPDGRFLHLVGRSDEESERVALVDLVDASFALDSDRVGGALVESVFSPDGRTLLYNERGRPNGFTLALDGDRAGTDRYADRKPFPLSPTQAAPVYSPDGARYAVFDFDDTRTEVAVYELQDEIPRKLASAPTHYNNRRVGSLHFTESGQRLVGLGVDAGNTYHAIVWELTTTGLVERHRVPTSGDSGLAPLLVRGSKGGFYLSGHSGLRKLDPLTGQIADLTQKNYQISRFDVSPDESLIIAEGRSPRSNSLNDLLLIDVATGELRQSWPLPGWIVRPFFHPDGQHVLTLNGNGTVYVLRLSAGAKAE